MLGLTPQAAEVYDMYVLFAGKMFAAKIKQTSTARQHRSSSVPTLQTKGCQQHTTGNYPPARGNYVFTLVVGSIMSVRVCVCVCLSHFDRGCLVRSTSTLLRWPIDTGLGSFDS